MIYETTLPDAPIRQGDIFRGLPRIDLSLQQIVLAHADGDRIATWEELAKGLDPISIIVQVRPVAAIVVTQDCDALRSHDVTLCEIREFRVVEGKSKDTISPKSWKNIITQQARINQKWFYLPPDSAFGFTDKMAVDFLVTLRVAREDLENLRSLRLGRLNATADEHFRERIGEFFRRYPYDEWYPLDRKELDEYSKDYPDTKPFPWQEQPAVEANG